MPEGSPAWQSSRAPGRLGHDQGLVAIVKFVCIITALLLTAFVLGIEFVGTRRADPEPDLRVGRGESPVFGSPHWALPPGFWLADAGNEVDLAPVPIHTSSGIGMTVPIESKWVDDGWRGEARVLTGKYGRGVIATKSTLDLSDPVWAVPGPSDPSFDQLPHGVRRFSDASSDEVPHLGVIECGEEGHGIVGNHRG